MTKSTMEEESVLSDLECPVCLLTPRSSPIYQCRAGHLVCSECRPRLVKCPVCQIHYPQNLIIRSNFAEKILEKVERSCRYELDDCKFKSRSSDALLQHETDCGFKPPDHVQEEDRNEVEQEVENEEPIIPEQDRRHIMLLHKNFTFTLIILRYYIFDFADLVANDYSWFKEYLLLFISIRIFMSNWAPANVNCFRFILMYILIAILSFEFAKMFYGAEMADFLLYLKPAVTLLTGMFSSLVHLHVFGYRGGLYNFDVAVFLLTSFLLAGAEVIWDMSSFFDWWAFFVFRIDTAYLTLRMYFALIRPLIVRII